MWLALLLAVDVAGSDACAGMGTALFVQAAKRVLFLCEDNRTKAGLRVALGTGGLGKRVQGDAKVPLGEYALTWPVASKDYHLFIPVGYPTDEQRKRRLHGQRDRRAWPVALVQRAEQHGPRLDARLHRRRDG